MTFGDISSTVHASVAQVEIHRPPHNFFDERLIQNLADAFETLDADPRCRAIVLASEGKSFCAGADFQGRENAIVSGDASRIYDHAVRLFSNKKPVVAAVQGAAVGGGLGVAVMADFRVATPETRFTANFVKLGIHPGFGLSHTLPRLIGLQRASLMFYTGRRVSGEEALTWGLADALASPGRLREAATELAASIAENAPLAVQSIRETLRKDLAAAVRSQTNHEFIEQTRLAATADHAEGILSVRERRPGRFEGT